MSVLKTIKCKCCGERGTPKNNSTLGYYCEKSECQDARIEKALKKVRQSTEAATKKANKIWNAERKQIMEKLKTLSDWKADLQKEVNLIARLIDKGQPCIASGRTYGKFAGGHFIAVGANATIRFHLDNIHAQTFESNSFRGGDNFKYRQGILKTYGKDYLDKLEALQSYPAIHLTVDDLKEKIKLARVVVKDLKLKDLVYNKDERIILRKIYNNFIGIYK